MRLVGFPLAQHEKTKQKKPHDEPSVARRCFHGNPTTAHGRKQVGIVVR